MQKEEKVVATWRMFSKVKAEDCAMIVIDIQNDFISEKGQYAKWGVDISHMVRTVKPIRKTMNFCREMNIPIIGTRFFMRGAIDGGILYKVRPTLQQAGLREGTWGADFFDELEISPKRGDWIIDRPRLSCFFSTKLEVLLRGLNKKNLIVTGVLTNQCVESTIRDAQFRDFQVLELSDCVGTLGGTMVDPLSREKVEVRAEDLHHASLRAVVFGLGDVLTSDELIEELGGKVAGKES